MKNVMKLVSDSADLCPINTGKLELASLNKHGADLDLDLDATGDAEFLLSQAFVSAAPVGK